MKDLYAFMGAGLAGRVVDSGFSRDMGKWVTVLDERGHADTRRESFWVYRHLEEMVVVDPGGVEFAKDELKSLEDRARLCGDEAPPQGLMVQIETTRRLLSQLGLM